MADHRWPASLPTDHSRRARAPSGEADRRSAGYLLPFRTGPASVGPAARPPRPIRTDPRRARTPGRRDLRSAGPSKLPPRRRPERTRAARRGRASPTVRVADTGGTASPRRRRSAPAGRRTPFPHGRRRTPTGGRRKPSGHHPPRVESGFHPFRGCCPGWPLVIIVSNNKRTLSVGRTGPRAAVPRIPFPRFPLIPPTPPDSLSTSGFPGVERSTDARLPGDGVDRPRHGGVPSPPRSSGTRSLFGDGPPSGRSARRGPGSG